MKCKKCGEEIESKLLYCPHCGEPIQLVPDYDVLEEELLSRVVEDKKKAKEEKFATGVYKNTPEVKPLHKAAAKKVPYLDKKHLLIYLGAFALFFVLLFCVIGSYMGNHTYNNLMNSAVEAEENGNYAKALTLYEEAYSMDDDSFEAIYGMGRMYYRVKEYKKSVEYLSKARELDPTNIKIYTYLLKSYSALKDLDSIHKLAELAPNDEIYQMISSYFVTPPTFSEKSGTYEDEMTIFLSASKGCQIFYTTNGKNPITSGKLYTKGIVLKEGTLEIKAVALNSDGDYSDVVSESYTVKIPELTKPKVTPEAGTYAGQQTISIDVPEGCTAYYSLDGSNPSSGGIEYNGPFVLTTGSCVLSVVVIDSNGNESPIYMGGYFIN
ncbi:chitobiase/beta-hexosaminidase C-terminal domain-containing protein [Pseudobutyrivibrio sp.]|uniref:chitobiase/beta-hexosaminidase C-terminal domain-containing protein n=1 Tax=Pseudobutyrivibrio sp. TaxID=2014367 RepID=UPI0025EE56A7|nr:chitobiase/beta-hexosaminidase C-terminal domain-containing protein [Pseudobutyrivibrio sp.]MBR5648535.1 chitobiase/beta-hexosaminidase C-terminal domain-containing protein [Pseudobutyrivibrio sp.]